MQFISDEVDTMNPSIRLLKKSRLFGCRENLSLVGNE